MALSGSLITRHGTDAADAIPTDAIPATTQSFSPTLGHHERRIYSYILLLNR